VSATACGPSWPFVSASHAARCVAPTACAPMRCPSHWWASAPDPGPRVQPGAEGPESPVVRRQGAPGESDSRTRSWPRGSSTLLDDPVSSPQH